MRWGVRRGGTSSPLRAGKPSWCNWLAPEMKMMHIAADFNRDHFMRFSIVALLAFALTATGACAATNTDEAARAEGGLLLEMVSASAGPVSEALGTVGDGRDGAIARELMQNVVAPLQSALDAWQASYMEIGWGENGEGNHYATYSDCEAAAQALVGLARDLAAFHEGRKAVKEIRLSLGDITIAEMRDCVTALTADPKT